MGAIRAFRNVALHTARVARNVALHTAWVARNVALHKARVACNLALHRARVARNLALHGLRLTARAAFGARLPRRLFGPRLGVLAQYPPRRLTVADRRPDLPPDPPLISIVTPSFNQAGFVAATLRSVLDQGYPRLQYLVIDGGSGDGSAEIIARHAEGLDYWHSQPDHGQTHALNQGFARTDGEIMAYLNSDDLLLPGALAHVADFFARHPEIDVVYGNRVVIDEQGRDIGRWILPPHDDAVLSWADFVPQETLFWRRRAWDKAGGRMDQSFRFAMDWDLLLRLRHSGARMARLPVFLGAFRCHDSQKTLTDIATHGHDEMARLRLRALGRAVSQADINRAIAPYLRSHLRADAPYLRSHLRADWLRRWL